MKTLIPPPVYAVIAAGLMWLLHEFLPLYTAPQASLRIIVWLFVTIGLALDLSSLALFLRAKTTPNPIQPGKANQLVIKGFYRFSRNPMYLGLVCLLIGWAAWMGSLSPLLVIPLFMWTLSEMQIKPEEIWLKKLFGDQYLQYKQTVRRWI